MRHLCSTSTVTDIDQLVQRLYQPGPPQVIASINDQLQQLQLSSEGWQLADALMGSNDPNVRFFAALTFTVKLNNDGSVLDLELSGQYAMLTFGTDRPLPPSPRRRSCRG